MNLQFNGNAIQSNASTLAELLLEQGFAANSHVATAVNGVFVAKTSRESHQLNDGDTIEVVAPMQGG